MQYSIWVIPPEPLYSQIKSIIDRLSSEFNGPTFEPHMTLLGNIEKSVEEIEGGVKNLVKNIDKLELTLGSISFSTTYFQSVFVRVNSTAKLMQLNLDAKEKFQMENDVFMPHMSLLYGEHDMEVREKAASIISLPSLSFEVDKLIISPATSDTKEWNHLATITL